jgi:hypothetical protein
MDYSTYPVKRKRNTQMTFTFESNNAQGTNPVTKVVAYVPIVRNGKRYYNLEFDDFHFETKSIDDSSITDNGDMRKVLKTVTSTLEIFFDEFSNETVRFDGSDAVRHSYYLKLIRDYYELIEPFYRVRGCVDRRLEKFRAGIEYDFVVVTKR